MASAERGKAAATKPESSPAQSPPAEAKKVSRSFHDFVPSRHAFHFRNGFQGQVFGTGESAYGLCGGMSFAAADYYIAGKEIPAQKQAPADGSALFTYIYSRQATSFGTLGAMGMKFTQWMQLPDDGADSTHARTMEGLPAMRAALSRGEPVVLGLVFNRKGEKAWDNHQVLAVEEVAAESDSELARLRIYDSNFPDRDDVRIVVERAGESIRIRQIVPGRRDIAIRGFFRMAYAPVRPPGE